jgi:hypothetical protein
MNREFMSVCGDPVDRNIWNHTILINSEPKIIGIMRRCQVNFNWELYIPTHWGRTTPFSLKAKFLPKVGLNRIDKIDHIIINI